MFPAVVALGVIGIFFVRQIAEDTEVSLAAEEEEEKLGEVFVRAGKVYIFVMALIFLGAGFKPLIDTYPLVYLYKSLLSRETIRAVCWKEIFDLFSPLS